MGRANREDVARLAGVSTAVVSYVVNDGPRPVAPATRQRVLDAMHELSYRPNASARALKLSRTNVIGFLLTDITNPYFSELALSLQDHAHSLGYGLLLANTGRTGALSISELTSMLTREPDGIALYGVHDDATYELVAASGIPVVSLDWHNAKQGIVSIGIDAYAAARDAVEHLMSHGHHEVGMIAGTPDSSRRRQSWTDLMSPRCSPERLEQLIATAEFSRQGGYDAARQLLDQANPPTAIFVSSDVQAFGAIRAIQQAGLRIPDDIALVSLDGTAASAYTYPALTAVAVPLERIAEHCINQLTGNEPPSSTSITLPHRLVVRESCGCEGDSAAGTAQYERTP